jgi:PAS domain S-box-containing protein
MPSGLRTICVPSADSAFASAVRTALGGGDTTSPGNVERRLRAWAPQAVIRLRELSGESDVTWYVYRDGAYAAERDARWHEASDVPWARYDADTGLVLDGNDSFVALLGYEDGGVIGHAYQDFVFSDATELAVGVYADIVRTGQAHSVVQLRRADGSSVTVEFVARAGDGSVEGWYRPITIAVATGPAPTR